MFLLQVATMHKSILTNLADKMSVIPFHNYFCIYRLLDVWMVWLDHFSMELASDGGGVVTEVPQ